MPSEGLLAGAHGSVPRGKVAETAFVGLLIVSVIGWILSGVANEIESYHAFDPKADHSEAKKHLPLLVGMLALFPLLGASGLVLLLPLFPYVSEHGEPAMRTGVFGS